MTSTHFHDDHDAVVRGRAESYRLGANGTAMYVPNNLTACGVLNTGDTISHAFGQSVNAYRGLRRVSHTASWAGYRTTLVRFPDQ